MKTPSENDKTRPKGLLGPRRSPAGALPFLRRFVTETLVRAEEEARPTGLDTFEAVWNFASADAVTTHRDRHVVKLTAAGKLYFLKRLGRAHAKSVLGSLLRLELPVSKCRREWEYARRLSALGIDSLPLSSFGERRLGFWPLESFLIMREIEGAAELDEFLLRLDEAGKRSLAECLAALVARMHQAGLFHRDLYAKHIFVRRGGGDFVINIIDLQRMRSGGGRKSSVKDLAALDVTLPRAAAGGALRLRFLRVYLQRMGCCGRGEARRFAAEITARSKRISGRGKFRSVDRRRRRQE